MRGVLRIEGFLGVRHVPRQSGACGSSCSLSVPGFCGRRRLGDGLGGTVAGDGTRRRLGIVVSRFVMNCNAAGRVIPSQQRCVPRPAVRSFRAPQRRLLVASSRTVLGAAKRRCRRPADNLFGAPSRGAGKAAAFSRHALQVRRTSVVTTAKLGSDDAARRYLNNRETRSVRGFSQPGAEGSKSAGKCQRAKRQFFFALGKKVVPRCLSLFARRNRMPC